MIAFPLFPAFLIASYFAARADIALARERGETFGARRWLVYPPMTVFSIVLLMALAAWPIAASVGLSHEIPRSMRHDVAEIIHVSPRAVQPVSAIYLAIGAVSVWWGILALIALRFPKLPGLLFPPFGSSFRRIDALLVLLLAGTAFVVWLSKFETAWTVAQTVLFRM